MVAFGGIPNDGVGRTARTHTKGIGRQELLEARQQRRREATPEHQLRDLPTLISVEDLATLRHDVPPVSNLSDCLYALQFLIPSICSPLVLVDNVSC